MAESFTPPVTRPVFFRVHVAPRLNPWPGVCLLTEIVTFDALTVAGAIVVPPPGIEPGSSPALDEACRAVHAEWRGRHDVIPEVKGQCPKGRRRRFVVDRCPMGESNSHPIWERVLSASRLPVPPMGRSVRPRAYWVGDTRPDGPPKHNQRRSLWSLPAGWLGRQCPTRPSQS